MDEERDTIGLFPLGLVILPGETLPLHIFEDRYKRLISECREAEHGFGIVYAAEDSMASRGCTAVVSAVVDEFEDGNMNIIVEGGRRFRVETLHDPDDPATDYLRADITFFADDEDAPQSVQDVASEAFLQLLATSGVPAARVPDGDAPLSFRLAGAVDFGADVKQALIDSASERERLADLTEVFRALVPQAEAQRKRAEAIRGNGKGT